jgi:hypothetical protein
VGASPRGGGGEDRHEDDVTIVTSWFRRVFGRGNDGTTGEKKRAALMATLSEEDARRVARLEERRKDIVANAQANANLAGGLLEAEVDKIEDLVDAFVELGASCARWNRHLATVDFDDLESEMRRAETDSRKALDEDRRRLAAQNLRVLAKRKDQLGDLRKKVAAARAEMELIENSLKLIADEVMVMTSPREIRGQLDELLVGVEAIRETTKG